MKIPEWQIEYRKLLLKEVIESPDCDGNCKDYNCCTCFKDEMWEKEEKEKRFAEEEVEFINSKWTQEKGYLGKKGCNLPRRLRPEGCLRHLCSIATIKEINKGI